MQSLTFVALNIKIVSQLRIVKVLFSHTKLFFKDVVILTSFMIKYVTNYVEKQTKTS